MIACCASRPCAFGPRLGHIRLRNDAIRRELVRNALSGEHPETSCLKAFLPETLGEGLLQERPEPSSQGGSRIQAWVHLRRDSRTRIGRVLLRNAANR